MQNTKRKRCGALLRCGGHSPAIDDRCCCAAHIARRRSNDELKNASVPQPFLAN
jgi:hypothetical protein